MEPLLYLTIHCAYYVGTNPTYMCLVYCCSSVEVAHSHYTFSKDRGILVWYSLLWSTAVDLLLMYIQSALGLQNSNQIQPGFARPSADGIAAAFAAFFEALRRSVRM